MRTLQINTMDIQGGAAKAAFRIFKGLEQNGVDSHMLVLGKSSVHPKVHNLQTDPKSLKPKLDAEYKLIQNFYIKANRTEVSNTLYSFGYPGRNINQHEQVVAADVVNLHMVDNVLSPLTLAELRKLKKPIVWTLHDEYAFTGGYHYSTGSNLHQGLGGQDLQLKNDPFKLATLNMKDKLKLWKDWTNLTIVSPSQWLADEAKKSLLFKDKRVEVIANGHPIDIFFPEDKAKAKAKLGLPDHGFTILFGAANGNEARKGFAEMKAAVEKLMEMELFQQLHRQHELHALSIGTPNAELDALPIPVVSTGKLEDEEKMRWAYSAADVMLFPSLEENLSNMILEAMACGVVPVAFRIGGNTDIVEHNVNGMMVELGDVTLMADYVRSLAREGSQLKEFSAAAVETVQRKFEQQQQGAKYLALYEELAKDYHTTQTLVAGQSQVPMDYNLGPNLAAAYLDLIKFTKKEFADQIRGAEPTWQDKLKLAWRNSLPGRAVTKFIKVINGVK